MEVRETCEVCNQKQDVENNFVCSDCYDVRIRNLRTESDEWQDECERLSGRVDVLLEEIKLLKEAIANCGGTCGGEVVCQKL